MRRLLLTMFVAIFFVLVVSMTIVMMIPFIRLVIIFVIAWTFVTMVVMVIVMMVMGMIIMVAIVVVAVTVVMAMAAMMLLRMMGMITSLRMITYGTITVIDEVVQQEIDPHVLLAIVRSPFAEMKIVWAPLGNFVQSLMHVSGGILKL